MEVAENELSLVFKGEKAGEDGEIAQDVAQLPLAMDSEAGIQLGQVMLAEPA